VDGEIFGGVGQRLGWCAPCRNFSRSERKEQYGETAVNVEKVASVSLTPHRIFQTESSIVSIPEQVLVPENLRIYAEVWDRPPPL